MKVKESTHKINGKDYIVFSNSYGSNGGFKFVNDSYVRVGEEGDIFMLNENKIGESISMKKEIKLGDSWPSNKGGVTTTLTVVALDGEINTPHKTYSNCLVLEGQERDMITRSFFQENIGMVATTLEMEGEEKVFIYLIE